MTEKPVDAALAEVAPAAGTQVGELIEKASAVAAAGNYDRDAILAMVGYIGQMATALETIARERDRLHDANTISDRIVGELNTEVMALEDTIVELRAQLEARPTTASVEWKPTHQHYKGGYYRVMARGRIEADLSPVVIYDNEAGETWVRPVDDFDQRDPFVRFAALALPRSPASPEPEKGKSE